MQLLDSTFVFYLNQINKVPLLTRKEEFDAAMLAKKGDKAAKQMLVTANLRFVVQMAKRYNNCGLSLMDLISEGNLGLMRAVESFEPEKGYHFISYAVHWIKQSIIKAISEKSKIMRIPLHLNNNISHIEKSFSQDHHSQITHKAVEDISKKLHMKQQDMLKLMEITRGYTSLDKELPQGQGKVGKSLKDLIEDDTHFTPERTAMETSLKDSIRSMLSVLTPYEAEVLTLRFGLDGKPSLTLQEIGKMKSVTKERIRQIEKKALETLKKPEFKEKLADFLET